MEVQADVENDEKKENLTNMIKKDTKNATNKLLKNIIEEFLDKDDENGLYTFFSSVYDDLYYDIIFKKINLPKNVQDTLEILATPTYKNSTDEQKKNLIKKILQNL